MDKHYALKKLKVVVKDLEESTEFTDEEFTRYIIRILSGATSDIENKIMSLVIIGVSEAFYSLERKEYTSLEDIKIWAKHKYQNDADFHQRVRSTSEHILSKLRFLL